MHPLTNTSIHPLIHLMIRITHQRPAVKFSTCSPTLAFFTRPPLACSVSASAISLPLEVSSLAQVPITMASCGAEPTSSGAPALPGGLNPAGMEAPSGLPPAADVPSSSEVLPSAGMQALPTGGEPPPGCEPAEKPPGPDDLGGLTLSHLRPIPSGAPSGTHAPFRAQAPCGVKRTLARQQTIQPEVAAQVLAECSGRQVPVASLADGTALPLLAREHCVAFLHMLGDPARLAPSRPIKIGTACTGSATNLFAFFSARGSLSAVCATL